MFWGVIIEPAKKYRQTVEKTFHLSMASLEINSADKEPVSLMLGYDNTEYVLCNLRSDGHNPGVLNCPLDLNFQSGERIAFYTIGKSNVHLSGYTVDEDDMDLSEEEEEEDTSISPSPKKRKEAQSTSGRKKLKVEAADVSSEDEDDSEEEEGNTLQKLQLQDSDEEEEEDDEDDDDEDEESEEEKITVADTKKAGNKEAAKKNKADQTPFASPIPNGQTPKSEKKKQGNETPKTEGTPQKKVLSGGVVVQDVRVGTGSAVKAGSKVTVYYVGRLKQNNKQFDATTSGPGFKFTLGRMEVIKGWDIGVAGMKVGGKRTITVPPAMAYGKKGQPPVIPPNSVLVFDVELRSVHN